ncbi:hypothetical protein FRC09_012482 [Ceratobasidium sp. 395]|nr:hypothetical protein FRC09_012482 [Ceratobasidium sp. 395]
MVQPCSGSRGRPSKEVKSADTKSIKLDLDGIPCPVVTRALYRAHRMDQGMMISDLCGPQLKVSWKGKGAGAGKNYLCTVDDNEEWEQVCNVILKLDPISTPVSILFHADNLQTFRKRTQVEPNEGFDEIARAGAHHKVPHADSLTGAPNIQVLQGWKLQELETALQCMTHEGEHGGPGQCWKWDDRSHVAMNMHRKKIWVAAIFTNPDPRSIFPPVTDVPATGPSASRSRRANYSQATLAPAPAPAHNDTLPMVSALTAGMVSALLVDMGRVPNPPALVTAPVVAPMPAPAPAP